MFSSLMYLTNTVFPITIIAHYTLIVILQIQKLDVVGPVDDIPSTNKLNKFVKETEKKKRKKCVM